MNATSLHSVQHERLIRAYEFAAWLALGLGLIFIVLYPLRINHDVALFLEIGDLLLDGYTPYVDYIEINLPLIHYINTIPAIISNVLAINPIPILLIIVWLGTAAAISAILFIRDRLPINEAIPITALALGLALLTILLFALIDYGQREHLFIICFLPALLVRWMRAREQDVSLWLALVVGLAASIGALLKPQFLIVVAASEIYWLMSKRKPRQLLNPEVYVFIAFAFLYLAHFLIIPKEMMTALFLDVLPSVLEGYSAYDYSSYQRLTVAPFAIIAAIPFLVSERDGVDWGLERSFSMVIVAGVLIYLVQSKGWIYHAIPALTGSAAIVMLMSARWIVSRLSDRASVVSGEVRLGRRNAFLGLLLVMPILLSAAYFRGADTDYLGNRSLRELIEEHSAEGDMLVWISTSVNPAATMQVQMNRYQGTRFMVAHPIAFALKDFEDASEVYRNSESVLSAIDGYLVALAEDIEKNHPPLILVDAETPCFTCPAGFRLDEFLGRMGYFDSFPINAYDRIDAVEDWAIFRLQASDLESRSSMDNP
jgi:hypothetical protein